MTRYEHMSLKSQFSAMLPCICELKLSVANDVVMILTLWH